jgi:hypothetical protein
VAPQAATQFSPRSAETRHRRDEAERIEQGLQQDIRG